MLKQHRWRPGKIGWLLCALCVLPLGHAVSRADDADDEGGAGANTLSPDVQWHLADNAWQRREYDDAAVLSTTFARVNPDHPEALEAWKRAYFVYRNYRPNEERRKATFEQAVAAVERWEKKYDTSDKNRAAAAMWYHQDLEDAEGNRPLAIAILQDIVKKYPGTNEERDGYWRLGEWMGGAAHWKESIAAYESYRKIVGNGESAEVAQFREGNAYEAMQDKQSAIDTYRALFNGPYNWGWSSMEHNMVDAANRLMNMGEVDLARQIAYKVLDKCPPGWLDVIVQARKIVGDKETPKRFSIAAYMNDTYTSNYINIDGQTKLSLVRDMPIILQLAYINADNPFKGTLDIKPKVDMSSVADNMTKSDNTSGKGEFKVDIATPDAKGNVVANYRFKFTEAPQKVDAPDGLIISRKWEKAGKGWGQCTIRVQSPEGWSLSMVMPNDKTNPNNFNIQPTNVLNGGTQFRWEGLDYRQGVTFKFPVEVGGAVDQFFPQMVLSHGVGGRYAGASGLGTDATCEANEYSLKMTTATSLPYSIGFPSSVTVLVEAVTK